MTGEVKMTLSAAGYGEKLDPDANSFHMNWLNGTLHARDLTGAQFWIQRNGHTRVEPALDPEFKMPTVSFGGDVLKHAFSGEKIRPAYTGNAPVLFTITPGSRDGYHLSRDTDLLRYYQQQHTHFYSTNQEANSHTGAISFSAVRRWKPDTVEVQLLQFAHVSFTMNRDHRLTATK